MGTRQIARGEKAEGGPFAYVIDPSAQHDQTRMVEFLRTFRIANIEVRQADAPFTAGGKSVSGRHLRARTVSRIARTSSI